jgi:hypothetical protein
MLVCEVTNPQCIIISGLQLSLYNKSELEIVQNYVQYRFDPNMLKRLTQLKFCKQKFNRT